MRSNYFRRRPRRVRTIDASSWSAEQVGAVTPSSNAALFGACRYSAIGSRSSTAHVDTGQAFALAHRLDEVVIDLAAPLAPVDRVMLCGDPGYPRYRAT